MSKLFSPTNGIGLSFVRNPIGASDLSRPGNVSLEVVKYFLQEWYSLDQDLRLDPNDFSLVTAN